VRRKPVSPEQQAEMLRCSYCGTLRGSLRFSRRSVLEGRKPDAVVICDLCVADLYRQCVENFGPGWPFLDPTVK
jgi:hypothetical protein